MLTKEITILGQYIKDLSFENPMAPNLPSQDINPTINLDVNANYLDLKNDNHEVNLKIKSTAYIDKSALFIIELQYAGMIKSTIKNEKDKQNLIISGSYLLFPYARSIISNITMEGGFKPFVIQPIKFEKMFKN